MGLPEYLRPGNLGLLPRSGIVAGRAAHSPLAAKSYSSHSNFITPTAGKFKRYWYNLAWV
jgi:hypothetical protein